MEGVSQLLDSVVDKLNVNHLDNYISTCQEHVAFYGKDKEDGGYVSLVNRLLNSGDDRYGGLLVLQGTLNQCSIDTFNTNALSWMSNCIKASNGNDHIQTNLAFKVLGSILKIAVKFPEVSKYAVKNVLPLFLENTKRPIQKQTLHSLLNCLAVCLENYPEQCPSFGKHIKNLLIQVLDSEDSLILLGARCFALLSRVKGDGLSNSDLWKTNQKVLINTLHDDMNLLFKNVHEVNRDNFVSKIANEKPLPRNPIKHSSVLLRMQLIERRIKGVSAYLQAMLLGAFPIPKPILPDLVFTVISRGLAINCSTLGPITNDSVALGSVLPNVHVHLLKLLMALIYSCGRNLILYGTKVCKLISQELQWTSVNEWPYAMDKPYRNLRSVVYDCLRCWLSVLRAASSLEGCIKDIIPSIMSDIKTETTMVTLKTLSKRQKLEKKKDALFTLTSESRSNKLGSDYANKDLCLQALKCLKLILLSYSTKIKDTTCKELQENILSLLFRIQEKHNDPPVPYKSISCRQELYQILLALCMEPHQTVPPPLTFALSVFNNGLMDPAHEISIMCTAGLSSLEKIIHPCTPPLPGSFEFKENKENLLASSQKVQESINDIPLTIFPNLNKITVIKVVQNDKSGNMSQHGEMLVDYTNSENLKTNENVTSKSNATSESPGDHVPENKDELNTQSPEENVVLRLETTTESRNDSASEEEEEDKSSVNFKEEHNINGGSDVEPEFVNEVSEPSIIEEQENNTSVCLKRSNEDSENESSSPTIALSHSVPVKKLKMSLTQNGIDNNQTENHSTSNGKLSQNETNHVNGINNHTDSNEPVSNNSEHTSPEDDMLSSFVDVVQNLGY